MPKVVPKFKNTLKFGFKLYDRPDLGEVSWSWKDQVKQFWESMEEEIRNTKDSLNFRARQRRAKKKANANQGSHPAV
jgi:hypothetical protein